MKLWLQKAGPYKVEYHPAPHPTTPVDWGAKPKGVVHTTEGGWAGAIGVFDQHYAPTFQVGPGRIAQFMPIGEMAAALENHSGGVETNADARAQIEIVGFSQHTPWLPDAKTLDALAYLLAELAARDIVPLVHVPNSQRRPDVWIGGSGWFGHDGVPENEHWDPGALKWAEVMAQARMRMAPTPVQLQRRAVLRAWIQSHAKTLGWVAVKKTANWREYVRLGGK